MSWLKWAGPMERMEGEGGEELVKVGWTHGKNGRGRVDEESGEWRVEGEEED